MLNYQHWRFHLKIFIVYTQNLRSAWIWIRLINPMLTKKKNPDNSTSAQRNAPSIKEGASEFRRIVYQVDINTTNARSGKIVAIAIRVSVSNHHPSNHHPSNHHRWDRIPSGRYGNITTPVIPPRIWWYNSKASLWIRTNQIP